MEQVTKRRRLLQSVACLLMLGHMYCITLTNVSRHTALGKAFHAGVQQYVRITGTWQQWDMFTTIPYYEQMHATLIAKNLQGVETRHGPMLPSLSAHSDHLKLLATFSRLTWGRNTYGEQYERYARRACDVLEKELGQRPHTIRLELDTVKISPLAQIQKTHRIGEDRNFKFGATVCR